MLLKKLRNWMSYPEESQSGEATSSEEDDPHKPQTFSKDIHSDEALSSSNLAVKTSDCSYPDTTTKDFAEKVSDCKEICSHKLQPSSSKDREEASSATNECKAAGEIVCETLNNICAETGMSHNSKILENEFAADCNALAVEPESTGTKSKEPSFRKKIVKQECNSSNRELNIETKRSIYTQTVKKPGRKLHSFGTKNNSLQLLPPPVPVTEKSDSLSLSKDVQHSHILSSAEVCPIAVSAEVSKEKSSRSTKQVEYGTLFVVGCNGTVPSHLIGSTHSRFILRKLPHPNGLKEAFAFTKPNDEPMGSSPTKHSISYPMPDNHSVVVAFQHDEMTDMFQIGRHEEQPVDFRVTDMNFCERTRNGVSRFACRIVVRRDGDHQARVYASAFDSTNNIFLGEGGFTWKQGGKMDGFTTNGVLIMHPFDNQPGIWREVSVCGFIYPLRSPQYEATKRPRIYDETNVLQDGTLIDLCGVTLMWRTPEGLKNTPSGEFLSRLQSTLNKEVPESPLLSQYLSASCNSSKCEIKKAYVFLSCGHVVGLLLLRAPENITGWSCRVCKVIGRIAELNIGAERGFYVDRGFPGYAFKPCGHAASLKTVKYWSSVKIPNHRGVQDSLCPFCGVKLNPIKKYVKLTIPCHSD